MKKVVLITSFEPNIGGGAVIFNSLIPALKEKEIEIEWIYLNGKDIQVDGCIRIGHKLMGGSLWKDIKNNLLLWLGIKTKAFQEILDKIIAIKADVYWIEAHNEGVLIARELAHMTDTPIHFTVHDDVPYGVFARSRRYRWLSGIAQKRFAQAIRSASGVDVISEGMRDYYQKIFGIDSTVIHRYLPSLPKFAPASLDVNTLTVGHIGTVYSLAEFRLFCQALQEYAKAKGLNAKLITIGLAREYITIIEEFPQLIQDIPQLTESKAIEQLSSCNFVYAMYPFSRSAKVFRQTSLATKITTYIQAQKPIFAHTPSDSTLATLVNNYQMGLICDRLNLSGLIEAIEQLCHQEVNPQSFESARAALFGYDNVTKLEKCLKQSL
jgi:glycosyltransferase involved in cell wall biosynthesis